MKNYKIRPVLLSVSPEFTHRSEDDEWAVEYLVILGDLEHKTFNIKKMAMVPETIGYNFWIVSRSQGYVGSAGDIDQEDIDKAIVLEQRDDNQISNYLNKKIEDIGLVDWNEFERKAATFLNISDIFDDELNNGN